MIMCRLSFTSNYFNIHVALLGELCGLNLTAKNANLHKDLSAETNRLPE